MIPRVFYIALGAAVGVVAVRKAANAVASLTPTSMAGTAVAAAREFMDDVREGMAIREDELREVFALDRADGDVPGREPRPA